MTSIVKTFGVTLPHKNHLCCAICKIVNCENDALIYSDFYAKKLKCRQFLQETPEAIAAPITNRKILETGGSIYIIVTKEFYESCTFRDHCDAFNMQVMDLLNPIPTYVYKACLLYTMEYKLASQWNKVGLYFVEGQDFLSSTGSVNAVSLKMKDIHGNIFQFEIEAVSLKIPFLKQNTTRPSQYDFQPPVRVLPSMKMANVLNISKMIKENLFKDYEQLRSYWKDIHGYILPEYEEGLLFYDVEFFYLKPSVFLYPETCLTSGSLKVSLPSIDPVPIIYRFIGELRRRMPKICEYQLNINPENPYQATFVTSTPKTSRFPVYDTGYGTHSGRVNNMTSLFRTSDTCNIPTKRMRLSLSPIHEPKFDQDFNLKYFNFNYKFQPIENIGNTSMTLSDEDNIIISKSTLEKDKKKSHYFTEEEKQFQSEYSAELMEEKEESKRLSLKEKLSKANNNK